MQYFRYYESCKYLVFSQILSCKISCNPVNILYFHKIYPVKYPVFWLGPASRPAVYMIYTQLIYVPPARIYAQPAITRPRHAFAMIFLWSLQAATGGPNNKLLAYFR